MGTLTFNDDFVETGLDGIKPQSWNTDVYPHFVAIRTLLNGNVDATNLGVTTGTVAASKVVTVDANKDAGSFRNITLTGELDAGTLDVSGNVDIAGITTLNGTLQVKNGATSAGKIEIYEDSDDGAHKLTLTIPALAGDVTLTLPNSDGSADQILTTNGSGTLTWEDPTTIDADLTAIGNLGKTDSNFIVGNGSTWVAETGATVRTSLGLGTMAVAATSDYAALAGATFTGAITVGVNDEGHDLKLFGDSDGAFMLYDADTDSLEIRGKATDSATSQGTLKLTTALVDINDNDRIGQIDFQAPLESGGTDAILVGARIHGEAEGTFSSSLNSTAIVFSTNTSAEATERFRITSAGAFTGAGDIESTSDIRTKENIKPIENALEIVSKIRGVTFNRKDTPDKESVGVIAQEVEEAGLTQAVSENHEGMKTVAYGNMVGLLIEAIKEQQIQIDKLTNA